MRKEVNILSAAEVESITAESVNLDAALFAHRASIIAIMDALKAEKDAIDSAILDKVNHSKVKTPLFYTIISDYTDFSKDAFIAEYGAAEYERFKVKPVHREQVRAR